jgi:hypothetical protein
MKGIIMLNLNKTTKLLTITLSILSSLFLSSLSLAKETNLPTLTDNALLNFYHEPYQKIKVMNTQKELGYYHGGKVVVDYPCSDVCPDYTKRIISIQLGENQTCDSVNGSTISIGIPEGIALKNEDFCVPKILSNLPVK